MPSLQGRHHPLAVVAAQQEVLAHTTQVEEFSQRLARAGAAPLRRAARLRVLQLNLGKLCNQTCRHCHVDAGPDRTEIMTRETIELCLSRLEHSTVELVDLTGGAPELNPDFRRLVQRCRELGRRVMDRCNLTVLLLPRFEDLVDFFAEQQVEVVASLPYYLGERTDAQRGDGVFEKSIAALHKLNAAGYGRPGSGLRLNLVYNPTGAFLPPQQAMLESDYRRELRRRHGIEFNDMFVITNMPISRFLEYLLESGNYAEYMERLQAAFNPATLAGLMCRDTLSVSWDGWLYDCDFNQMLDWKLNHGAARHIRDVDLSALSEAPIVTGRHCYGCTAGAGSSCGGALA